MGVYIPNMDKPKKADGININFHFEDSHIESHIIGIEEIIDIVTCGECMYYEESEFIKGDMVCKYHMGHTYYTEADRFCCYGERRSE